MSEPHQTYQPIIAQSHLFFSPWYLVCNKQHLCVDTNWGYMYGFPLYTMPSHQFPLTPPLTYWPMLATKTTFVCPNNIFVILLTSYHPWVLPSLIACPPPLCCLGFEVISNLVMLTPIVVVGFAPSVHVTRVSFTLVNCILFTLGFVFAKLLAMTGSTIACNCSMPRAMATSRTFSTWPIISSSCISIAQIRVEKTTEYDLCHNCK